MKRKIGLYNPYLNILGGGEKHILSILKALETDSEISIFWDQDLSKEIKEKFDLQFTNQLHFLPNIFSNISFPLSTLKTLQTLWTFDLFFYVTDGSYFFSSAKKNYVFCMVPLKKLYPTSLINKLKTLNYSFITNSKYTSQWLEKWGIKNQIIYPYIHDDFFKENKELKEKIILSVGRFFSQLHSKQHATIIETFNELQSTSKEFKNYKLILAGSLQEEDKKYFSNLQHIAKINKSIIFKPNLSYQELYRLYRLSTYYWHMTGFGINEIEYPEMVEHLGITPLEAMASGCITFCFNAGGPKELIKNQENGFLFNTQEELINMLKLCNKNQELREKIINNAKKFVKENFSYYIFQKRVKEIVSTAATYLSFCDKIN